MTTKVSASPIPGVAAAPVAAAGIDDSFGDRADDDRDRDAPERRSEQMQLQMKRGQERREETAVPLPTIWLALPPVGSLSA
ncbi:hypothetical protein [Nocardia sp. NPDC055050]